MGTTGDERRAIARRLAEERVVDAPFVQGGPRVALLYPSPYRVGMASLGFQRVLALLRRAGLSAERAFLPDDPEAWRASRRPLATYETATPVGRFPVVGVSLAYELELAGLVTALDLAGVPPLAADRGPGDPLVVVGGPITFSNPRPVAPFADALLLGEADDTVAPAFEALAGLPREAALDAVEVLPGGWVPSRRPDPPDLARAGPAALPARGCILAPEAELADMFLVEGERGCHRGCAFCVMRRGTDGGMRLVDAERVLALVPEEARRVGLVGAGISDHPALPAILERLLASGREVGVSSLRADRVAHKPRLAELLRAAGHRTLTVASDAASQRLRRAILKGTTEGHLLRCAELAREHDYRVLKVYMMVGLPGETDADLDELVAFTRRLAGICPVELGVAPFVPKLRTPLADAPFAGIRVVDARLRRLSRGLRGAARVRPTSARWAWVEAALAQGGPEAGRAVLDAVRRGGRFADYRRTLGAVSPVRP